MTRKLEELFDLPPSSNDSEEESASSIPVTKTELAEIDDAIDKIDAALPGVKDLETGDAELDDLAKLAKEKAEDLLDLGMNIDPRFAGVIMQTAGVMIGHAISAKTAKMDKKLRMINLQLQKAKFDHQLSKDSKEDPQGSAIEGNGVVLDRNELLKQILASQKK